MRFLLLICMQMRDSLFAHLWLRRNRYASESICRVSLVFSLFARRSISILAFLYLLPAAMAMPSFLASPEGEVVSDRIGDLNKNPEFVWAVDPFLQLPGYSNFSERKEVSMQLQATMPDGEMPMAILNDEVVHVGDQVGKKIIYRIGPDFVLLKEKESIVELNISDNEPAPTASSDSRIDKYIKPQIDIEEVIQ